ncbi:MAG: methylated-DNA--[protein]-cysteine S-methyltransferase [Acidaminococcaceae bacterium]|nr:methylated-DNA--[protein]-cysteine S-methyltransferase [Acidaminococcaceae bacterium]MDD4722526.1 methylated-DNA--[protein]-cysteine S-methyltransferase [Acidaminococcaceae bacterium]
MLYTATYQSPLGILTMASDGENLIGLWIKGQKHFASTLKDEYAIKMLPVFAKTVAWLDCYFSGNKPTIVLPLAPKGTEFRQQVWRILSAIPYGQTITYGEIARRMAKALGKEKMSAQAVGGAVGHNPISIIIPCHRVVGTGGNLTGYAGGIDKKIKLLKIEHVNMDAFCLPKSGITL